MNEPCDKKACPAAAVVNVGWPGGDGTGLWLCGHHYRENEVALLLAGWQMAEDRRGALISSESPTAPRGAETSLLPFASDPDEPPELIGA